MAKIWFQCKRFPQQSVVLKPKNKVVDKEGNVAIIGGKYLNFSDGVASIDSNDKEGLEKIRGNPDYISGLITEHDEVPGATVSSVPKVTTAGVHSGKREPVVAAVAPIGEPLKAGPVKVPGRRKRK